MSDSQNKSLLDAHPLILLATGATLISFAPIFVKMIGLGTLGLTAIGFWRCLFGALTLALIGIGSGRKLRLTRRQMFWAVAAGFAFCADLFVWHRSIAYAGAGMATILGNTQVFATSVLSIFIFKEKLTLRFVVAAITAMAGVVLLVGIGGEVAFSEQYIWGIAFGLATGLAYASYIICLKQGSSHGEVFDVAAFMTWASFFAAIFLGIASLFESEPFLPPDWYTLGVVVALGVVAQALGWLINLRALRWVHASSAGLVLLLQPILATVWGFLFFSEKLLALQLLGAVITLASIYVGSLKKKPTQEAVLVGGRRPRLPQR
jgi:drug/metabolite transporter (DMT)-like permease